MVPWYGCGMLLNNQVIVRWIKLQGVRGEQDRHRDHQLHFGDTRPQTGMVTQAKWRVGARFAMLVARRAEPLKIKLHGVGIQLLQEMGHDHIFPFPVEVFSRRRSLPFVHALACISSSHVTTHWYSWRTRWR